MVMAYSYLDPATLQQRTPEECIVDYTNSPYSPDVLKDIALNEIGQLRAMQHADPNLFFDERINAQLAIIQKVYTDLMGADHGL